jgi:O-antigen ligase
MVLWVAMTMGLLAISFPVLRAYGLVPLPELVQGASLVSEERAQSLQFRFDNEDILLDRALERPVFGWGTWGRNRVYDDMSGQDTSVTDGLWILEFGGSGWLGFLAIFGLLFLPILYVCRALRGRARLASWPTVGLVLFVGVNMLELLPNSTLPPWTWLIAGSLVGWSQRGDPRKVLPSASRVKVVGRS